MKLSILPSALLDIAQAQFFYESIEEGLGMQFRAYIVAEIDRLAETAGIHPVRLGYYRALANRFHQSIYYKIDGDCAVVWRVLDQRFNPRRVRSALAR